YIKHGYEDKFYFASKNDYIKTLKEIKYLHALLRELTNWEERSNKYSEKISFLNKMLNWNNFKEHNNNYSFYTKFKILVEGYLKNRYGHKEYTQSLFYMIFFILLEDISNKLNGQNSFIKNNLNYINICQSKIGKTYHSCSLLLKKIDSGKAVYPGDQPIFLNIGKKWPPDKKYTINYLIKNNYLDAN
ncbi:hypothetical protein KKF97_07635, partial [Myxococcota bacterium]|nr:hypothetical protein [Myxococcota bacterium]